MLLVAATAVGVGLAVGGDDDPGASADGDRSSSGAGGSTESTAPGSEASSTPSERSPFGTGLPMVGECRVLADEDVEPAVNDAAPVPCSRAGVNARTIHVGYLDRRDTDIVGDLGAACLPVLAEELGVEPSQVNQSLATTLIYWPSDEQWANGARWWRCDAAMLSQDRLTLLPTDLSIVFEDGTPLTGYRACLDLERDRVLCENSAAYFMFVDVVLLDGPATFPGDAEVNALAAEECPSLTGGNWYATWPSAATWEQVGQYVQCWTPIG